MKKAELSEILYAIENFQAREKKLCADYCRLNPADAARREHDRDMIIYAAQMIYAEIHTIAK